MTFSPEFIKKQALFLLFFLLLLISTSCSNSQVNDNEIIFFAASSLTDVVSEIVSEYERQHPTVTVRLNFAGSSQLATQLIEGASAHLFASANETQMQRLVKEKLITSNAMQVFTTNQLVLILPIDNPAGISSIADLAQSDIKFVTASEDVPIGQYTRQSLAKMESSGEFPPGFEDAVLANIVSEEANVRQLVTKIQLGEADAAIAYQSDVQPNESNLSVIPIPKRYNVIARYPIAQLQEANGSDRVSDFIAFMQSAKGQSILKKWGFSPPSLDELN